MVESYIPDRGDLVWIGLTPHVVHEQAGQRPALVVSPASYNGKVGLAMLCPITSRVKGNPFEVTLPDDAPVSGVVLADQVKSLDWKALRTELVAAAPDSVVAEVLAKLAPLFQRA